MSSHDEIQDLIPDFAAGRASEADRRLLEAHLQDCAECRAIVEECAVTAADLKELVATELQSHPDPGQFARFAEGGLKEQDLQAFELHLDVCAECSEKLATIRLLEREVQYEVVADAASFVSPVRRGFREILARPVLVYGIAFAAVVILAVPVMRSLLRHGSPAGEEKVVQLAEQTRSGLSRQSITLSPDLATLILEIRFIPAPSRTYSIIVVAETGKTIHAGQLSVQEIQQGSIAVRIGAKDMPSGDYSAVLTGTPTEGEPLTVYYPFTIKR